MTIGAVIVAAGLGTRFRHLVDSENEANKLMAICSGISGSPLSVFTHTLQNTLQTMRHVVVVTRPEYRAIQQITESSGCQCICIDSQGIGDSIAAGVKATKQWRGWLITLADMPFIRPETYTQVVQALKSNRAVRPVYQDQPGHPVGFAADFRDSLMALNGDQGAKNLFAQAQPYLVPVNDPGILFDIDTPQALLRQSMP
ncbi:nucleotidyltransferase family protein [Pragia fontium]|uniref:Molybdenum cofactor cytidylyltransferase n=1 Tax=Pragia fontium DSM 5563 = ATCC 49100 TaxID=1122977 RepID=A0AAJ5BID2_9GAMM|nr:nucleotidyltransferase family protein [Pragia fontium]SFD29526.1 molybdenum cofactor cytidylyltransferase [Pragia fontium DSM 5563 = ATCC 49100]